MTDVAIRVENLSKQYRIGTRQAGYQTLRESLVEAVRTPFRRMATQARWFAPGDCGGDRMIRDKQELQTTQERIAYLQRLLMQLRETARRTEFWAISSGYRLEIERMQAEVLDYLTQPIPTSTELAQAENMPS